MNLKITGLNFDVTEAIKNYVSEKIGTHQPPCSQRHFRYHYPFRGKLNQQAEADIHLAGKDLHVEAVEQDMYAAIDVLMDKLDARC